MTDCACATSSFTAQPGLDEECRFDGAAFEHTRQGAPSEASADIGSQKSVTRPMLIVPLCPTGPTPTIVTGLLRSGSFGRRGTHPRRSVWSRPGDSQQRRRGSVCLRAGVEPAPEERQGVKHG